MRKPGTNFHFNFAIFSSLGGLFQSWFVLRVEWIKFNLTLIETFPKVVETLRSRPGEEEEAWSLEAKEGRKNEPSLVLQRIPLLTN